MFRTMLKSKIHRATVTEANLEYEGSVSIDSSLMAAADLLPHEQVDIWNCSNGARLQTYAIPAAAGSGEICINGAAAHLVKPGHIVIIASFVQVADTAAPAHQPRRIFVNAQNEAQ